MWDVVGRLGALLRGCGALMLAGPADAQDSELWKRFAGAWEGRGEQAGTDGWTIFIVLDPPGKGKISYPSLDCGGTLALLESRRNALVFHEQIHLGQTALPALARSSFCGCCRLQAPRSALAR